jgi:OOP family OmpA-OmpF porin
MIKQVKLATLAAALLGVTGVAVAQTAGVDLKGTVGYVIDQRGNVVKDAFGLCWRTGFWTPALAIEECDPDLVKKPAPPPPPPPKVEPPKPAPAPAPAAPAPKPAAEKITLAADALFDFDKAVLLPAGTAKLDELSVKVRDLKLEVIVAVGHADRFGSDDYNQKLSEKRAEAVKAYLVGKGVEPNRVYSEGKGKKQPVTTADQCKGGKSKKVLECLQPDRRVEIEVIGTREAK